MKLRAKIILTAASLALSCALLVGCGSSSGSTASSAASSEPASTVLSQASSIPLGEDNSTDALNAPFETLLDANPISNQFEIAAMNIEYDFNLPAEDVVSYKGVKSNDNGDAGMVLVVEAADGKPSGQATAHGREHQQGGQDQGNGQQLGVYRRHQTDLGPEAQAGQTQHIGRR